MNLRRLTIVVAPLILAVVGFWVWRSVSSSSTGYRVTRQELLRETTFTGTLRAKRTTKITPPFTGYVMKIFPRIGQQVKAGDPLVTLSQSGTTLEQSFPIRAPFAGTVTDIQRTEGENANVSETTTYIVRVDDLSSFYVVADVPEQDWVHLKEGQSVEVTLGTRNGKKYSGIISGRALTTIVRDRWSGGGSDFPVWVNVSGAGPGELTPGLSAQVTAVIFHLKGVVAIPHGMVLTRNGQPQVKLASGQYRPVKLGRGSESLIEVTEGLAEGELLQKPTLSEWARNE